MTVLALYTTMRSVFNIGAGTDVAGYEIWPSASVRAAGFDDGFTGVTKFSGTYTFPKTISVDGGANGADAHDVYLSQRTDIPADQYLSLTSVAGKSGSWSLALTANAVARLGIATAATPLNHDQTIRTLKHCTLYCQRHSDNAIQLVQLYNAVFTDY